MSSIVFTDKSTSTSGSTTSNSVVLNVPAGASPGNYIIVAITYTGGTGVTITPPAGFVFLDTSNTSTTYGVVVYRKFILIGETSYTFGLSAPQYVSALACAFSGLTTYGAGTVFTDNSGTITTGSGTAVGSSAGNVARPDPAYALAIMASFNTSAQVSLSSPPSGFTTLGDVSTTATDFVEVSMASLDNATTGLRAYTMPAGTLSGSTTNNVMIPVFLRQDMTQLTVPNVDDTIRNSVTATSINISLGPSIMSERAVLYIYIQGASGTVSSVTTSGVNWTLVAAKQDPSNTMRVEVWTGILGPAAQVYTAVVAFSGSVTVQWAGVSYVKAGSLAAIQTASGSTGAASSTLTTTGPNAIVVGALVYAATVGITANNGNTLKVNASYVSGTGVGALLTQTASTVGSSVTSSVSAPTTSSWAMVQFEVIPPVNTGAFLDF